MLLHCDYYLGILDGNQRRAGQLLLESESPDVVALQIKLDRLRYDHIGESDQVKRTLLAVELRQTAERLQADSDSSSAIKLQARLTLVSAEAVDSNSKYVDTLSLLRSRSVMGLNPATAILTAQAVLSFKTNRRIDRILDDCVHEAARIGHPILTAEAFVARAVTLIVRFADTRVMLGTSAQPISPPPSAVVEHLLGQLQVAETYFRQSGSDEGVIRATLLQADWLVVCRRDSEALARVISVEGLSYGLGLARHIEHVAKHIARTTEYHQLMNAMISPLDNTVSLAATTDVEIKELAEFTFEALELPIDRFEYVERDWLSLREVAREQISWCRQLEILQDRSHESSLATHYRTDPERVCHCMLHNFHSVIGISDWITLITSFKGSRCSGCRDRSPRDETGSKIN